MARPAKEAMTLTDLHCGIGFGGGRCPSLADYVIGTGLTDGATAPPEVMDLREFWSNPPIPTLFLHRSPVNSHALMSRDAGDH
jgi:hypothetical protein